MNLSPKLQNVFRPTLEKSPVHHFLSLISSLLLTTDPVQHLTQRLADLSQHELHGCVIASLRCKIALGVCWESAQTECSVYCI